MINLSKYELEKAEEFIERLKRQYYSSEDQSVINTLERMLAYEKYNSLTSHGA